MTAAGRRPRRRWLLAGAAGLPLAFLAVLVVEAKVAAGGDALVAPVYDLDGVIEPPPGVAPAGKPIQMAVLGDSTAAGVGASSPDASMPRQVARALNRTVYLRSFAKSGARIDDVLQDQIPQLLALWPDERPDIVLIDVGANDVTHLTRVNAFRSAYLGVLDAIPEGPSVIVLGVPDMGSVARLPQPLRFIAGVRGGTYDNVVESMRDQNADYVNIADFTGPRFGAEPDRYFAGDRYHPNDEGYRLWAETILPVLNWRLYKREHPGGEEPLMPKEAKGTFKGDAP